MPEGGKGGEVPAVLQVDESSGQLHTDLREIRRSSGDEGRERGQDTLHWPPLCGGDKHCGREEGYFMATPPHSLTTQTVPQVMRRRGLGVVWVMRHVKGLQAIITE